MDRERLARTAPRAPALQRESEPPEALLGVADFCPVCGAELPPQEVDAIVRRLVMRGLAAELGLASP